MLIIAENKPFYAVYCVICFLYSNKKCLLASDDCVVCVPGDAVCQTSQSCEPCITIAALDNNNDPDLVGTYK